MIEYVKLERDERGLCVVGRRQGTFSKEDKTYAIRFSTPDGNGPKLDKLLSELTEGDTVLIAFNRKIVAPKTITEEDFASNNPNSTQGEKE